VCVLVPYSVFLCLTWSVVIHATLSVLSHKHIKADSCACVNREYEESDSDDCNSWSNWQLDGWYWESRWRWRERLQSSDQGVY